jgi:hypothetical protein
MAGFHSRPNREQFAQLIGRDIHYHELYNASEGFFASKYRPDDDGMLLFVEHGIFYEFMPIEEYGKPNPQTIGLNDVELNKNYAMVITTNGGLWRYMLGDTIEFTSLYPFRIKVTGRLKHFINAFGEEVIVDNTDNAVASACRRTGAVVNDYTAAPVYFSRHSNGAHEWLVEFEKEPANLNHFTYELDSALKNLNSDYEAKTSQGYRITHAGYSQHQKGIFNAWLKSKGKLGGQHKVPRLSNNRKHVDEILLFMKTLQID